PVVDGHADHAVPGERRAVVRADRPRAVHERAAVDPDQHGQPARAGVGRPHVTVAGNVGFGLPAGQRRGGKVDTLLETVGLGGFGRRYPHQLSGGQQQRVALARALAIEPAVVLLDEPFASLDAHLRASVRADVQEIFRRAGTTAVLVT